MAVNLTILGLGKIGASLGLALSGQKEGITRTGLDLDITVARKAEDLDAIDRVALNYKSAVENANVVILAVPFDQIHETLTHIAPMLIENAVVIDTAPVKQAVLNWADQLLPADRYYVGLVPAVNPKYLVMESSGLDAARSDLFEDGLMAIVAPPSAHPDAIRLAGDLTKLVGSSPLFVDQAEIDGLMASTHIAPQLLAAALVEATVDQAGWRDARKIAGTPFAQETGLLEFFDSPDAVAEAAANNPENTVRVLNNTVASIQSMISNLKQNEVEALKSKLSRAGNSRSLWWKERQAGDWLSEEGIPKVEYPTASSIFGRLLGRRKPDKPKK